jgi:hypothetical protein
MIIRIKLRNVEHAPSWERDIFLKMLNDDEETEI